jgi:hypothetical protein
VDAGDQQQADLVNKTSLQQGPVDISVAFEQQRGDLASTLASNTNGVALRCEGGILRTLF